MRWCTKIDKYQVGIKLHIPHQKSTRQMRKEYGRMNWWLVYVPDVLDWKLDKALMDSKLLFWDISIRSMSKTNYQFGSRLYLRKQKKCIFRLLDQNNKHEHQLKTFFHGSKTHPPKTSAITYVRVQPLCRYPKEIMFTGLQMSAKSLHRKVLMVGGP